MHDDVRMVDFEDAAEQLYAADREEFTALRARLAKEAADADTRAAIGALAKPTTAGWLVNRLARQHPDEVAELVDLGADLRDAHARMAGDEIRTLSGTRTTVLRGLMRTVRTLPDRVPGDSVLREVEDILTTTLANETAAQVVSLGRVTSAKEVGDDPGWPLLSADTATPRRRPARRTPATDTDRDADSPAPTSRERGAAKARNAERDRALAKVRGEVSDARATVKKVEAGRARAERALAAAESDVTAATDEVGRLKDALADAQQAEAAARAAATAAKRAVKDTERAAGRAWAQLQQAERRLNDLSADD